VLGYVVSGHMVVVQAEASEWTTAPFTRDGKKLLGRGTTDMKG
jgi:acetylornithine deacetylase